MNVRNRNLCEPSSAWSFLASIAVFLGAITAHADPGDVDLTFNPMPGTDRTVRAVVIQPDGQSIVAGRFTSVNGVSRNRIARLNADGGLDLTFDPGSGPSGDVNALALQADGKILVGGEFSNFGGFSFARIVRLNGDGTLDMTFDVGTGANGIINAIALQDDKVLIGGEFTEVNGTAINRIARLNSDGSVDSTFDPGTGIEGFASFPGSAGRSVHSIVVDAANDNIYLGGAFAQYNGQDVPSIVRIDSDGAHDTAFTVAPSQPSGIAVYSIGLQPDGKAVIGGQFYDVGGVARNHIARLNADGSVDQGFFPGVGVENDPGELAFVDSVVLDSNGKVLIGGNFSEVSGFPRNDIARLNTDGSLDTTFAPGTGLNGNGVQTIALQSDGKILVGGNFTQANEIMYSNIVRLLDDSSGGGNGDPVEITEAFFENGIFTVSFVSQNGVTYVLQYKESVTDADWISIGTGTPGNGGILSLSDPNAGAGNRFYQVIALDGGNGGGDAESPDLTTPVIDGETFGISLVSETGFTYFLEFKDALGDPDWTRLTNAEASAEGDGNAITLSDTTANVPTRFYRVVVE